MKKFKVTYVRNVTEVYEAIIEAEHEYDVTDVMSGAKYGEEIPGETLVESYSDGIEVNDVIEIGGDEV